MAYAETKIVVPQRNKHPKTSSVEFKNVTFILWELIETFWGI
jgi:hypothetical protein